VGQGDGEGKGGRPVGLCDLASNIVCVCVLFLPSPLPTARHRQPAPSQEDKAVVNGAHDSAALQTLMNGFVSRFVLCPKCSLPETTLVRPASASLPPICTTPCTTTPHLGSLIASVLFYLLAYTLFLFPPAPCAQPDREAQVAKDFSQVCSLRCQGKWVMPTGCRWCSSSRTHPVPLFCFCVSGGCGHDPQAVHLHSEGERGQGQEGGPELLSSPREISRLLFLRVPVPF
jgi:hypothetical protein